MVAGIPVNYDEAKVGTYTLPDPLKLNDGKPVRDAKTWYANGGRRSWRSSRRSSMGALRGGLRMSVRGRRQGNAGVGRQGDSQAGDDLVFEGSDLAEDPSADLSAGSGEEAGADVFQHQLWRGSNAVDDPGITPGEVWDPKTNTKIPPPKGRGFGR